MKWNLNVVTIGVLSVLATLPVHATEIHDRQIRQQELQQVRQWQTELAYSFCNQDWTTALSVSSALMGSEAITSQERWWLYVLQQDMLNYSHNIAEFKGCEQQGMVAGMTGQVAEASVATNQVSSPVSLIDWRRSFVSRQNSFAVSPADAATPREFAVETEPIALNTTCRPYDAEERRVANGSVSNQWNYETWQDSYNLFYVLYWRQDETCEQASSTSHQDSQRAAYREFRNQIGIPLAEE